MHALLTAIVMWLSANFDLPAAHDQPRIEFASATKIAALRYKGLLPDRRQEAALINDQALPPAQREVVAVYHDATRTIYLREGWTGTTPTELSVLVHEMVHHLQSSAGLKFECPQAREKLAYAAQDKWLGLFGRDLATDFEIDPFTLVVTTRCIY